MIFLTLEIKLVHEPKLLQKDLEKKIKKTLAYFLMTPLFVPGICFTVI